MQGREIERSWRVQCAGCCPQSDRDRQVLFVCRAIAKRARVRWISQNARTGGTLEPSMLKHKHPYPFIHTWIRIPHTLTQQRVVFRALTFFDIKSAERCFMYFSSRSLNGKHSPLPQPTLNLNWRNGSLSCCRWSLTSTISFPTCATWKIGLNWWSVFNLVLILSSFSLRMSWYAMLAAWPLPSQRDRGRSRPHFASDLKDLLPMKKIQCNSLSAGFSLLLCTDTRLVERHLLWQFQVDRPSRRLLVSLFRSDATWSTLRPILPSFLVTFDLWVRSEDPAFGPVHQNDDPRFGCVFSDECYAGAFKFWVGWVWNGLQTRILTNTSRRPNGTCF